MATRKIKDAKDLSTNELIYFKGHAQATYMSDGRTVEEAVNSMSGGSGSGNNSNIVLEYELNDPSDPNMGGIYKMLPLDGYNNHNGWYLPVYGGTLAGFSDIRNKTEYNICCALDQIYACANGEIEEVGFEPIFDEGTINIAILDENNPAIYSGIVLGGYDENGNMQSSIYTSDGKLIQIFVPFFTGNSIVSQNITIIDLTSGGSSGSSSGVNSITINGQSKTPSSGVVDLGYVNKQLSTSTSSSMTLSPNIYYRNTSTSLSTLTITLGSVSNSNILNEYFVEFTTRDAGTTVSLPNSIKWANGVAPTFENGKTYQISIVNNLGTCVKFG